MQVTIKSQEEQDKMRVAGRLAELEAEERTARQSLMSERREALDRLIHLLDLQMADIITRLAETDLPVTEVAFAAGFGSVRRFNDTFQQTYGKSPRELRRGFKMPFRIGPMQFIDFALHPRWSISSRRSRSERARSNQRR